MQIKTATPELYPFLETLYIDSFPPEERRPFSYLIQCTSQKKAQMLYLYDEEKDLPIGMAFTLEYEDMVLLDYFAISSHYRNKGYGATALTLLKELFADHRFFLEIELPDETAPDNQLRLRRKNFYLRNGMHESSLSAVLFTVPMEVLFANPEDEFDFTRYHELYVHCLGAELADNVVDLNRSI